MNRQEPQSSPQPLEEELKNTSGVTILFSRKDVVPAGDSGTDAASETQATEGKTTVSASLMLTQKADLTGIFRKVKLENRDNGNEQAELISSQQAESVSSAEKEDRKNPEQEFTQVLQPLSAIKGKDDNASRTDGKRDVQPAAAKFVGDFTQLLRILSAEAEAEVPTTPTPLPPQPVSSPGEFTRIISGAMLREAQGRIGALERTDAQKASAAAGVNSAKSAAALPEKQRAATVPPPVKTPQLAPQPQAAQDSAPAQNKLQQYVPLLLAANFLLMLVVLVLLAFVFLHRYK